MRDLAKRSLPSRTRSTTRAWCRTNRATCPAGWRTVSRSRPPASRTVSWCRRTSSRCRSMAPVVATEPRPSSEWRMHAAIYRARPDVLAIVHTHSPHATALAAAGRGIPPFHYMIALAGGDVRCMPYATFGTAELAESAVRGLQDRRACLLGNHGVMAIGARCPRPLGGRRGREPRGRVPRDASAGLVPQLLDDAEISGWSPGSPTTAGWAELRCAGAPGCRRTGRRSRRRRRAGACSNGTAVQARTAAQSPSAPRRAPPRTIAAKTCAHPPASNQAAR